MARRLRRPWFVLLALSGAGAGCGSILGAPDVPVGLVLLAVPVTLVLANLIAAGPGWDAAQVRPAAVLRTE